MAQYSKSKIRGFLVGDPRYISENVWEAESDYTQAGAVPGPVTATGSPRLRLATSGETSGDDTIQVRVLQSGTNLRESGRLGWRRVGDADWRGWDPPVAATQWQPLKWHSGTGVGAVDQLSALCTSNGTALCAYRELSTTGPNTYDIKVARTPHGGSTSLIEVAADEVNGDKYPTMMELPDGTIQIYFWVLEEEREHWNIVAYRSTDDGESWTRISNGVLQDGYTSTLAVSSGTPPKGTAGPGASGYDRVNRIAVAYLNGQVALFVGLRAANTTPANQHTLRQFSSVDLGCTFQLVELESAEFDAADKQEREPVLLARDGQLYLLYIGNTDDLAWKVLSSASKKSSEVDNLTAAISEATGHIAAAVADDGTIWIYTTLDDGSSGRFITTKVYSSVDRMQTLVPHGISGTETTAWEGLDGVTNNAALNEITACFFRGGVALYHTHEDGGATYEKSLSVLYLGGWATAQLPSFYPTDTQDQTRTSWEYGWTPVVGVPDTDSRISVAGGGSGSISAAGLLEVSTAIGQTYIYNMTVANQEQITVRSACSTNAVDQGGETGLRVTVNDGANYVQLEVRMYATGFRVYDQVANALRHTESGLDLSSQEIHLLVSLNDDGDASVWYHMGDPDGDLDYIEAYQADAAFVSTAGGLNGVEFGALAGPTAATLSRWTHVFVNSGDVMGQNGQFAGGFLNPADCYGQQASKVPSYFYEGLRIASTYGPGYKGDIWSIEPKHTFAALNVVPDHTTSPREAWRTTADNVVTELAFDYTGFADNTLSLSPLMGVYLSRCNWRTGLIEGYVDGGAGWVTVLTVDMADELNAAPFDRQGNVIVPNATSFTSPRYFAPNELVGATVDLGSGVRRKVIGNTGGYWTDDTTTQRVRILLDEVTGADPATGTFNLWYPEWLGVFDQGINQYRAFRLRIDAQLTVDGYYSTGQMVMGGFFPFSQDHSYGWVQTQAANVDLTESADWRRKTKRYSAERRTMSFAWTEGMCETSLKDGSAAFVAGTVAGVPASLRGDIPPFLMGLHAHLSGSHIPLVYVSDLAYNGDPWTVTDRAKTLYGRMMGDVEVSNVTGDEDTEIRQVQTIVVEEEL